MPLPRDYEYPEPVEDVHTPEKPFCYDVCCSCQEDELLVHQVYLFILDGLMTPEEAVDFVMGKGI